MDDRERRLPSLSRAAVDRAAHRRTDEAWLAATWADPTSRVVVVEEGRTVVDGVRIRLVSSEAAPPGERYFLGVEGETAYWAVAGPLPEPGAGHLAGLREVGVQLDDRDAGLLTHAVALANWHAAHRRCPRCGADTEPVLAGSVRRCREEGSEHYPGPTRR